MSINTTRAEARLKITKEALAKASELTTEQKSLEEALKSYDTHLADLGAQCSQISTKLVALLAAKQECEDKLAYRGPSEEGRQNAREALEKCLQDKREIEALLASSGLSEEPRKDLENQLATARGAEEILTDIVNDTGISAEERELTESQLKGIPETVARLEADRTALELARSGIDCAAQPGRLAYTAMELERRDRMRPLEAVVAKQEAALARKAAAYPAALKRHLNKCRRKGISDSRLISGKK